MVETNNRPLIDDTARRDLLPGLLMGLYMVVNAVTSFWMPIHFDNLGYNGAQIGLLFSIYALAGLVAALPAGLGNDRITSRVLVIAALLLQTIALFLMGTVALFTGYLLVYFAYAFGNNAFRLSMEMQLLKTDTGRRTGSRVSAFVAWRFGGLGVGSLLTGYLLHNLAFSRTFFLLAACCLLLIVPALRLPPTRLAKAGLTMYLRDLRSRRVLLFIGWLFLFTTHWGVENTCYSLFLKKELGLSLIEMSWYISGEFVAIIITALLLAPRMNRLRRLTGLGLFGLSLSGIGHIGMVIPNVWLSFAFRSLHGIGDGAIMILLYLGIARLFNIERLGGNSGVINLAMTAGMIAGALIAGPLGEAIAYSLPIWTSGILILVLTVPVLVKHLSVR